TAHKAELPGWQAAGKTGTSQDFRDAWFIGYTSHLLTGGWLGHDDKSPTKKATGGGLPVEIWTRFMKAAHQGVSPAPLPASQPGGMLATLAQVASPGPAPASLPPAPVGNGRPAPTRASASSRPEAAGGLGLDGWLV